MIIVWVSILSLNRQVVLFKSNQFQFYKPFLSTVSALHSDAARSIRRILLIETLKLDRWNSISGGDIYIPKDGPAYQPHPETRLCQGYPGSGIIPDSSIELDIGVFICRIVTHKHRLAH